MITIQIQLIDSAIRTYRSLLCFLVLSLAVLSGCAGGLSHSAKQALSVVVPHDVDFEEFRYYALRSDSAYDEPTEIRETYPNVTRVTTLPSVNVRYFIETDDAAKTQTISVRGTASNQNAWQDTAITIVNDSILGLGIHKGFQGDALAVWNDAEKYLLNDYDIRVTGHSLGAAIALLVGDYADVSGFNVVRIVNFGQPKVTRDEVSDDLLSVVTRVIDNKDVVPMVPPPGLVHQYRHVGPEVILRPGSDFVFLDEHDVSRVTVDDFWREFNHFSIDDHLMANYIANLDFKLENGARQVPYLFLEK